MELRRVLFGYRQDHTGFHIDEEEAGIVRAIFASYISGDTMKAIASGLTDRGVLYYQNKSNWDNNMVKRILDNPNYCGCGDYPPIISTADYEQAASIKERKNYRKNQKSVTPAVSFLKTHVFCESCGNRVTRRNYQGRGFRWLCENQCTFGRKVLDEDLSSALDTCISQIKMDPHLTEAPADATDPYTPSLAVRRAESELNHSLEQETLSFNSAARMVVAGLSEQYACCSFIPGQTYTDALNALIQGYDPAEADQSVLEIIIRRVTVDESGSVSIEFRNRAVWREKWED